MNQRLLGVGGQRRSLRQSTSEKQLTRYAHEDTRPDSSSQLTRFRPKHAREEYTPSAKLKPVERVRRAETVTKTTPVVAPKPVNDPHTTPRASQPPQPKVAQAPVTAPLPRTKIMRGPDLDLFSDAPIPVSVLRRALPLRFKQMEADIKAVFRQPENTLQSA